jgi:ribosomal protein S18 acetylase RimI-like enzyme
MVVDPTPFTARFGVVRLGVDDAGELLTLQRAAFVTEAQRYADLALPPLTEDLADLERDLTDPAVMAFGLRDRGRLVASVRVRIAMHDGERRPGTAVVQRLVVAPDQQGRGLGRAIMVAAESALPDTVTTLTLFTGERSTETVGLYVSLGYAITDTSTAGHYNLVHLSKNRQPKTTAAAER